MYPVISYKHTRHLVTHYLQTLAALKSAMFFFCFFFWLYLCSNSDDEGPIFTKHHFRYSCFSQWKHKGTPAVGVHWVISISTKITAWLYNHCNYLFIYLAVSSGNSNWSTVSFSNKHVHKCLCVFFCVLVQLYLCGHFFAKSTIVVRTLIFGGHFKGAQ